MTDAPNTGYVSRPYWHDAYAPAMDAAPPALPDRVDVCVVGAGYTGTIAALALARGGATVAVLDRNEPGWGASTRNGGIFHPGLKWGRAALVKQYGPELGEAVFRGGIESFFTAERFVMESGFECDYRRSGFGVLAWSDRHLPGLRDEIDEYASAGLTARMVLGAELQEEVGTSYYPGAIIVEEAGMIHPAKYYGAVLAAARSVGVQVFGGTPVRAVEQDGADRVVVTERGRVRAGAVLVATNGYTDGAVPWLQQRVMPIGSYIVATEPMTEELAHSISPRGRTFFDSKNFLYYWHVNAERRLIFGGRASFAPTSVDRTAAILTRALALVHPQAADLKIDYAWGGNVGFTFDRLPHLGEHEGIHYALGYCGSGLALGTSFGLKIAEKIGRGADTVYEPSPFERIPFPTAPFIPFVYQGRPWFLPFAGEWFRLADKWARRGTQVSQ
jgi:glycine/D-amino acid oxidase-like deaminating enzyme